MTVKIIMVYGGDGGYAFIKSNMDINHPLLLYPPRKRLHRIVRPDHSGSFDYVVSLDARPQLCGRIRV